MFAKLYLLTYNGTMLAGWTTTLFKILQHLISGGNVADAYGLVSQLLVVFQSGAVLEVLHSLFGLVRSPVSTTFIQVLSRLLVLFGALEIGPSAARTSLLAVQMIVAWCLAEIIRYAFYVGNLAGVKTQLLTWLRYSAFTVLYPMGISGEIACFWNALPYIRVNKPWTMELPNQYNWCFSWYHTVWFLLLFAYPAGSYVMYSHMLRQRAKVLCSQKPQGEKEKTA
ncbi:putative Protein tyrosine phosphatase like protein PTPLA [Trypanosoma vivax]|uniref:very-long-chain (3R)-3-hydroxyacyl-CoA dehydratase n=1 Tax=Trypanosoma vivax (strain Y486) TaxID=1055687 RepID=G0U7Y4_TRYVY|nr:putative protein tyrosine phosphatase [Trypanosoma vivax]KAH8606219.1 putative Protein tyrosine phosphatase like protein PTPLA [Trypanosoma vivax]CCC51992.1 putative protein tyrosine phosphatase [Trypanosoma vivax Y486]